MSPVINTIIKILEPYKDTLKTEKEWIEFINSDEFQNKLKEEMLHE